MITKDVKRLLEKLNEHTTRALETAAGFSISRTHYEVGIEHLLAKLMEDGAGDIPQIFNHFDVKTGKLWEALLKQLDLFKDGNTGRPSFSPVLLQLVESAWITASVHHGYSEIRSGALLEALIESESLQSTPYFDFFASINRDELRQNFVDIVGSSSENTPLARRMKPSADGVPREGETALDMYMTDLTGAASNGEIDPVNGRDQEIRQIIDILSRRRKNNPILVGEAGVGKTAVVEGLALRLAAGDVPDSLKETEIRCLDLGLLQAGAGVKGEFEQRLKSVIEAVSEAPKPTIMFIDEAHTLIGAGGSAGTGDAANLIKPALARGELRTIAATTWSEYKKYIEKDPALERRFQLVKIDEPTVNNAIVMLRGIKSKYEDHHHVPISDEAVQAAAQLSARFVGGRQLPDKAVDLLDTAAARVKMAQTAKPSAVDDAERRLHYLDLKITAIKQDLASGVQQDPKALDEVVPERAEMAETLEALNERWEKELDLVRQLDKARASLRKITTAKSKTTAGDESKMTKKEKDVRDRISDIQGKLTAVQGEEPLVHAEVNASIAAQVISDWTGIPAGAMEKDEAAMLLELDDRLQAGILGQDEVIAEVADTIRTSKSGMRDPSAPHAVFLFVGPSGVGKTELGLRIADIVYGGERFLTTINMSEYQEKHTVSQLKGSPPGYVGYGEGGILTEAVRRQPYSVLLLDEVEKAHLDVMNLFYQVFDKGFMRDGEGREIDFKNTIIIMTSNLATDVISYVCTDDERPTPDQIREAVHPTLAEHFRPALLGRMKVVPFYPLRKEPMKGIVKLKLNRIGKRLHEAHKMDFQYAAKVVERIAERCTQADTGARNIDFIIDRTVMPEASKALISRMAEDKETNKLVLGLNKKGDFTYKFS
ncbi:MAG: type VI secretion system ATPase TssH [Rhodothermia bacterium]|nr:MAG: type VI secretion system ATPase TssH [Rhodothermia bacterium]